MGDEETSRKKKRKKEVNHQNVTKYRAVNKLMRGRGFRNNEEMEVESDIDDDEPNSDYDCEQNDDNRSVASRVSGNDDIGGGYHSDQNDGWMPDEDEEAQVGLEGNLGQVIADEAVLVQPEENDPDPEDDEGADPEILEQAGFEWFFVKYRSQMSRRMKNELLATTKRKYNDQSLPADCRTLEPKIDMEDVEIHESADKKAHFAHFYLRIVLQHLFRGLKIKDFPGERADLWLYIDGVTFTDSSRHPNDMWPVVGRVSNVRGLEEELVLIGLHHGGKPLVDAMMSDFFDDLDEFQENPFLLDDGNEVHVRLHRIVADSPARDMLKCIKSYNSKAGCERCECTGKSYGFTMTFTPIYHPDALRTDESFRNGSQPEHHHFEYDEDEVIVRKQSIFERRCPNLDMVKDFILEPMHLCYLCAGKRFVDFLLKKVKNGRPPMNIRDRALAELNQRHYSYHQYCPREFARLPKQLTGSGKLKATEYRQLFLYTGLALFLDDSVAENVQQTFLMFFCALRILSDPDAITSEAKLRRAQFCMQSFVRLGRRHFGGEFVTFSVHSMLHMTEEVRYNQMTLEQISAFISENCYRHLKTDIRSGNRPTEQVAIAQLMKMAFQKQWFPRGVRQKKQPKLQFKARRRNEDQNAEGTRHAVIETRAAHYDCEREQDRYCEVMVNGAVVHIQCEHFVNAGEESYVEGRCLRVEETEEAYDTPLRASELGIFLDAGIYNNSQQWPIQSIKRKLYRLPFNPDYIDNRHVLIPLLHKPLPEKFD
jgi:hypothetical protein